MLSAELFKASMRRLAAGVCVVTTRDGEAMAGLVATSVSSLSIDPPALVICINRASATHDVFMRAGILCVNILGAADGAFARQFANADARKAAFESREWDRLVTGAPALIGAEANVDCRIEGEFPFHSHTILVANAVAIRVGEGAPDPLVYLDGGFTSVVPRDGD
jgi:flavin reductase